MQKKPLSNDSVRQHLRFKAAAAQLDSAITERVFDEKILQIVNSLTVQVSGKRNNGYLINPRIDSGPESGQINQNRETASIARQKPAMNDKN